MPLRPRLVPTTLLSLALILLSLYGWVVWTAAAAANTPEPRTAVTREPVPAYRFTDAPTDPTPDAASRLTGTLTLHPDAQATTRGSDSVAAPAAGGEVVIDGLPVLPLDRARAVQRLLAAMIRTADAPTDTDTGTGTVDDSHPFRSPPLTAGSRGPNASHPADAGFTRFTPSPDTRIVYVSSSTGDDANDGRSPQRPVRTPARGYALLRDGQPDWLLFKAGDTFTQGLGNWSKSGASAEEPLVIATYGTGDRPRFECLERGFIDTNAPLKHLRFVGLHLTQPNRNPDDPRFDLDVKGDAGFRWLGSGKDLLFEDLIVEYFHDGFILQPFNQPGERPQQNVTLRRCIVRFNHPGRTTFNSEGLFIKDQQDFTIDACVLDHNGHLPGVADDGKPFAAPTIFNHNAYLHSIRGLTVRDSLITRGSSFGVKIRSDQTDASNHITLTDNLFWRNVNHLTVSGDKGTGEGQTPATLQHILIQGNAFADGGANMGGFKQAYGVAIAQVKDLHICRNLFLPKRLAAYHNDCVQVEDYRPREDVRIDHNVAAGWDDHGPTSFSDSVTGVTATDNTILPRPQRTVADYARQVLNLPDPAAALAAAADRPRGQWPTALTAPAILDYLRKSYPTLREPTDE